MRSEDMHQIRIRVAQAADARSLALLINRAYRPAPREEGWTHESALVNGDRISSKKVAQTIQSGVVLIAENGRELLGCVHVEVHDRIAHIGMLAVDPALQRAGIGKLLLARGEAYAAQECNAQTAALVVIAARTELLEFYLRRGYTKTDTWSQYPLDAGIGTPTEEAMLLVTLRKSFGVSNGAELK